MKEGEVVRIDYVGRIQGSGELFDTTRKEVAEKEGIMNSEISYGPIPVIVGAEMVVEGVDEKLEEMEVGEEEKFSVPPEKAFGKREGDLIKTFSEKEFKDQDMSPYPGMRVNLDGRMGRILSVNSGRVRVDLNHPLAGKTLDYEVKVEEMVEGEGDEVKAVGEYYLGEEPEVELGDGEVVIELEEEVEENIKEELKNKIEEYLGLDVKFEVSEEVEEDGSETEAE